LVEENNDDESVVPNHIGRVIEVPTHLQSMTSADFLTDGLSFVGFNGKRQADASTELNIKRYKAFYGEEPNVHAALFSDLRDKYPDAKVKEVMITLNWFKGYDNYHVLLAGRWLRGERWLGPVLRKNGKMIQSLMHDKIKFKFADSKYITYLASYDTVNFKTTEFRLDPSNKWFDPKSHSSGLVSWPFKYLLPNCIMPHNHKSIRLFRSMHLLSTLQTQELCGLMAHTQPPLRTSLSLGEAQ
jgi:hypothetical protein